MKPYSRVGGRTVSLPVEELALALVALALAVGVGTVAHELSHAAVLWAFAIPFRIEWLPDSDQGLVRATALGTWATVTPRTITREASSLGIRLAALAPLALATPGLLVFAGVLADPTTGHPAVTAAALGWLGCAIPSPSDFAAFWNPTAD